VTAQGISGQSVGQSDGVIGARGAAQACHEEWEMDGLDGAQVAGLGWVSLVQIDDVYSRVKLASYPCLVGPTCCSQLRGYRDIVIIEVPFQIDS
jgi:hypothetical protein